MVRKGFENCTLQQALQQQESVYQIKKYEFKPPIPRIICNDGVDLSVQAGAFSYCSPRNNKGPYTHVEIGYPSEFMGSVFEEYSDGENIFTYVPIWLVETYIAAHGGINHERSFDEKFFR